MTHYWVVLSNLFLLVSLNTSWANIEARQFPNSAQEKLYFQLISELRCLVCQHEKLSTSNAEKAEDVRDEVFRMVILGSMDKVEIKASLVKHYGDNILYQSPEKKLTWLYGLLLFILPVLGLTVLIVALHRNQARSIKNTVAADQSQHHKTHKNPESRD